MCLAANTHTHTGCTRKKALTPPPPPPKKKQKTKEEVIVLGGGGGTIRYMSRLGSRGLPGGQGGGSLDLGASGSLSPGDHLL